jgi:cell division control protein 6
MLGILDRQSRNEGRSGGQYYEYNFAVDLETVREVVADLEGVVLPGRILRQL